MTSLHVSQISIGQQTYTNMIMVRATKQYITFKFYKNTRDQMDNSTYLRDELSNELHPNRIR